MLRKSCGLWTCCSDCLRTVAVVCFFLTVVLSQKNTNNSVLVLDLLKTLDVTSDMDGISSTSGSRPGQSGWRFHSTVKELSLPASEVTRLASKPCQALGFIFTARQSKNSEGVLLSIFSPSLEEDNEEGGTFLEIGSDLTRNHLRLTYRTLGTLTVIHEIFRPSPFRDVSKWTQLAVHVGVDSVKVYVDCQDVIERPLIPSCRVKMPKDSTVYFSQNFEREKFTGYWQEAKMVINGFQGRPWYCFQDYYNVTAAVEEANKELQVLRESAAGSPLRIQDPDVQSQGFPVAVSGQNQDITGERVSKLERTIDGLTLMINMMKQQQADLLRRIAAREQCACNQELRQCVFDGDSHEHGEQWQTNPCAMCTCEDGQVVCSIPKDRPECFDPCTQSPCLNNGRCVRERDSVNFTCACPPTHAGPRCQYELNVCVQHVAPGECKRSIPRFFYNLYDQKCQPFVFSGCNGNGNNFKTLQDCQSRCVIGACCHRTYGRTNRPDVTINKGFVVLQQGVTCQVRDLNECRRLEVMGPGDNVRREVVAFQPGQQCEPDTCRTPPGCVVIGTRRFYRAGTTFKHGCQQCTCEPNGNIDCRCVQMTVRKEIRDMTSEEMKRFHEAVQELKDSGPRNAWDEFRDLYMHHISEAKGGASFLPWNRLFLRRVEQKLQELDCGVVLPYFDFTTDVGNFAEAIIWQANYFGGNGKGACIPDNPFEGSQSWRPCLVRDFNLTVQLPTMVDMLLAISSNDYETMRSCLETYAAYVNLFIGGDMKSVASPYDPVYFAIYSYIDFLYWRWQNKPGNRPDNYPEFLKEVPMYPFHVRPEDVLNIESQLCYTYRLPSIGTPCNNTDAATIFGQDGFNELGFNRQGFDRNGFDVYGFNLQGYDRRGMPDSRNFYSADGYDQLGYDRSGYDRLGYNQYGYNKQGFNRDGFDNSGYDRNGFDRYGYDRDGYDNRGYNRQGYNRQGEQDQSEYYGPEGFCDACYDVSGLTRSGYDRYGYNLQGYNQQNCNYSYGGPHVTSLLYRVQDRLYQQNKNFLMTIERTCVELQPLPVTWYEQNWIQDRKDVTQMIPVRISQYPGSHWADRFCFKVDNFISACPCDTEYVICRRNPCAGLTCPAFPQAECRVDFCGTCTAVWFVGNRIVNCDGCSQNGEEHGEGSSWQPEPCQSCTCQMGRVLCAPIICPPPRCRNPVSVPGECCPSPACTDCEYKSKLYSDGTEFIDQVDVCQTCTCQRGNVECARMFCPQPQCSNPIPQPGKCCPVCPQELNCGDHSNGDRWQQDPCTTCTCLSGVEDCVTQRCPPAPCQYPRIPAGRCCPECKGCEYEGRKLRNGQIFDADRCTSCTCLRGQVECRRRECPVLLCQEQYTSPGDCCPRCEGGCEYEMMTFDDGTYFTPMSNPCLNCSCLQGLVRCNPVPCPPAPCANPVKPLGRCCPICPACTHDGAAYSEGQTWRTPDNCQECSCRGGSVNCANLQVCRQTCPHGVRTPGTCCSPCTDCFYEGQSIRNGMTFVAQGDLCNQCRCSYGVVQCVREQCQPVNCVDVEVPPGSCCPVCRGCVDSYGQRHVSGAQFRSPEDRCQLCTCTEGSIVCRREACQVRCDNPVQRPGQCCALCDGCTYQGVEYRNGAPVDKQDPCTRCICQNGDINCQTVRCAATPCANPIVPPGECCPVCGECTYDGQTYPSGETFVAPRNPCLRCTCRRGELDCDRLDLECRPQCTSPGRLPDVCCPVCDICEYERRNYRNGARFRPPGADVCTECSCLNGNVRCSVIECQPVNCANPTTKPDECCPACQACFVNGREYAEGQTFRSPNDPCADCICSGGRAQCEKRSCNNVVQCTHPVTEAGQCCPVCTDCLFDQRRFTNGQRFQNPSNPCQTCYCESGNVRCDTTYCQPPNCFNPVRKDGQCCPECPEEPCLFENQNYNHAQQFTHPTQPCTLCACNNGEVTCQAQPCPSVPCRQPAIERCCGTCEGCIYQGQQYRNGAEFAHPTDRCRVCSCRNGNVMCIRRPCPPLECPNPVRVPGKCCPECPDMRQPCTYGGDTFEDGERFTNPGDTCQDCVCRRGQVTCNRMPCPSVTCPYPVRGECCQSCNGCFYSSRGYTNGQEFTDPVDKCSNCICQNGYVQCAPVACPPSSCPYPEKNDDQCCPVCRGCEYDNHLYTSGQTFADTRDPCRECTCVSGDVRCVKKTCPPSFCTHPSSEGNCGCPSCEACMYGGVRYANRQEFPDPSDPCRDCMCSAGNVNCQQRYCPNPGCTHPAQGECCPKCGDCQYQGQQYSNRETFPDPRNPCQQCTCTAGNVVCMPRMCPPPTCTHPEEGLCGCMECNGCQYQGVTYLSGASFKHPRDPCQTCRCASGTVNCQKTICRPAACPNPMDGQCCPECDGCKYSGKNYANGATFEDPNNDCNTCSCVNGQVSCNRKQCVKQCDHPEGIDGCCPRCEGCRYEQTNYRNGETFSPVGDPCEECICTEGTVNCGRTICPRAACPNPISQPGQCCPECQECTHSGRRYYDGQTFVNPLDPCEECRCVGTTVMCSRPTQCAACSNPVSIPGQCCPSCQQCSFEGQVYNNGQAFNPDACRECSCANGNVQCISQSCPPLSCPPNQQVQEPGACCKKCLGCFHDGQQYQDGHSWVDPINPCMSCQCRQGITTCAEIRCITPCANTMSVPGQCCPVCSGCMYNNRTYQEGETFNPNGDPCDQCTCEDGNMRCLRYSCENLDSCPPSLIRDPRPGECCPVCLGEGGLLPLMNCTADTVGNNMRLYEDPCYKCMCEEANALVCVREVCPNLNCPLGEQYTSQGECCPGCDRCFIGPTNQIVLDGESYTDPNEPCVACTCNRGVVTCKVEECLPLTCMDGLMNFQPPDRCCEECRDEAMPCMYLGESKLPDEEWLIDECTMCSCVGGEVMCMTERCPPTHCESDETPTLSPGMCCPRCMPRPATCTTFGDPHYRTFDGKMIHFQGTCVYTLAADCDGGDFEVLVQNDDRGAFGAVSWTQESKIKLKGVEIELLQKWVVKVNGLEVNLPYLRDPVLFIEKSGSTILVNTEIGLKVLWNGHSYLEVSVPGTYKRKTCGLCGNFNNFPQDDMRLRNGQITNSASVFGNSWKVDTPGSPPCEDSEDLDPCVKAGYRARKEANAKCLVLKSDKFMPCHRVINPEMYFASCVYDLCACGSNDQCLCDALGAYAAECSAAGVVLNWRSPSMCAIGCPSERGLMFDECGPICPRTCANKHTVLGDVPTPCFKPCIPSCQCPAGQVLWDNQCVTPGQCPDTGLYNIFR
ncbi:kielin/chordin-like protein isoform X1 [Branchiostoma floridae x Branchiostoma japonicum]